MGARVLRYVPAIQIAHQIEDSLRDEARNKVSQYGWQAIGCTGTIYEVDLLYTRPHYMVPMQ